MILNRATRLAGVLLVTLILGFVAGVWYAGRRHQDHWITSALRPTFLSAQLEGDVGKQSPLFFYQLSNTTGEDYTIREMSDVELFVRDHGALDSWMGSGSGLTIDVPVVVPARQKANVTIHFKLVEREQPTDSSQAEVASFLGGKGRTWNQYDGIVLLDKRTHYEIDFPLTAKAKGE
jgi:hypothetical protein